MLVQKKYQEKDTRRCRPCGLPCAARQWRDAKNSLPLRQVWRLFPPPSALLSGTGWETARLRIPAQVLDIRMNHIVECLADKTAIVPFSRISALQQTIKALDNAGGPVAGSSRLHLLQGDPARIDQQKNMVPGVDLREFNVIVIQRNKEEAANREWWRSKICCVNGWKDKN